ncbi:hypothetical protein GEMRC1_005067 [Eukaryota sp. GEM-RC1]
MFTIKQTHPGRVAVPLEKKSHYDTLVESGQAHIPYCHVCKEYKSLRSKHCSQCQKCVAHLDHHCIWLHNCIGQGNRKLFIAVLLVGFIDCLIASVHFFLFFTSDEDAGITVQLLTGLFIHPIIYLEFAFSVMFTLATLKLLKTQVDLVVSGLSSAEAMSVDKLKAAQKYVSKSQMTNLVSFFKTRVDWGSVFLPAELTQGNV